MAGLPFPLQPHQDSGKSLAASSTQLHHVSPGELLKAACQSTPPGDSSEQLRQSVVSSGAFHMLCELKTKQKKYWSLDTTGNREVCPWLSPA